MPYFDSNSPFSEGPEPQIIAAQWEASLTLECVPKIPQNQSSFQKEEDPSEPIVDFKAYSFYNSQGYQTFFQCLTLINGKGMILSEDLVSKIFGRPIRTKTKQKAFYERIEKEGIQIVPSAVKWIRHSSPVVICLSIKSPQNAAIRLSCYAKRNVTDSLGKNFPTDYLYCCNDCLKEPLEAPFFQEGLRFYEPKHQRYDERIAILRMNAPFLI
jgi:hypothetical protein